MPELPEVETVVSDLHEAGLVGRRLTGAGVHWPRSIASPSVAAFKRQLRGARIVDITRRGKYIVMRLADDRTLCIHLRMTGRFRHVRRSTPRDPHEHVVLHMDNGYDLRFHDTRKFGRWTLSRGLPDALQRLGPEPLDARFTSARFRHRLPGRKRRIKPLLLDQQFIAGIGNIYADEALFAARIHPMRRSDSLTGDEQRRLYRAIRRVLRQGVRHMGTTLGTGAANFYSVSGRRGRNADRLKVFRRAGQPCPACGATIERIIVGQRSTHICPACQSL